MITREIIKNEGFKGMFRGLVPTFAREMPGKIVGVTKSLPCLYNYLCLGYFCFFGGYELCRHVLTPPGKSKDEIGLFTGYFIVDLCNKVTQNSNYLFTCV